MALLGAALGATWDREKPVCQEPVRGALGQTPGDEAISWCASFSLPGGPGSSLPRDSVRVMSSQPPCPQFSPALLFRQKGQAWAWVGAHCSPSVGGQCRDDALNSVDSASENALPSVSSCCHYSGEGRVGLVLISL